MRRHAGAGIGRKRGFRAGAAALLMLGGLAAVGAAPGCAPTQPAAAGDEPAAASPEQRTFVDEMRRTLAERQLEVHRIDADTDHTPTNLRAIHQDLRDAVAATDIAGAAGSSQWRREAARARRSLRLLDQDIAAARRAAAH